MKKFAIWKLYGVLCLLTASLGLCGCGSAPTVKTDSEPQVVQTAEPAVVFSFENAAVLLPSPVSVQLDPEGRLGERFQGNINYVRYRHDYYGEDVLDAFATRHYSLGKLLERISYGENGVEKEILFSVNFRL